MKEGAEFYKPFSKLGLDGYYIPVRNSMNNKIEQEFIPEEAKVLFETQFGERIIMDEDFYDWYEKNAESFTD